MISIVFAAALAAAPAQHAHEPAATAPATLQQGLEHHPIATTSAKAQQFFDQGLTLVYGFNHEEAIRSFQRAAELDPASPMPHWGIAYALGPNINLDVDPQRERAAYDEAQRALALAAAASEPERAYAQALAVRYSNGPNADLRALAVRYRDAMRELTRRYPDDLDAAVLYAESIMDLNPWKLWSSDGKPADGTEELIAVLESVLRRDPMHVGANHYYIHATEASPTPERAMVSAQRLETLVPSAGHLVHMPAHIYMRTGDYAAAVSSNEKAAAVDRAYFGANRPTGVYAAMYYGHNLDFLAVAAMMSGQSEEAYAAAAQMVALVKPMAREMPMLESYLNLDAFALLRYSRFDEVLGVAAPDPAMPAATAMWHYTRGVALAQQGHAGEASREQQAFHAAGATIPAASEWGYNKTADVMAVADAVLAARVAWAKGEKAASIDAWTRAVAAQDRLSYDEPPDWYYPVRESLGAALLQAGRAGDAERVFRDDLDRNPRNGRSLFGLWKTLEAQHRTEAARIVEGRFREAWTRADVPARLEEF